MSDTLTAFCGPRFDDPLVNIPNKVDVSGAIATGQILQWFDNDGAYLDIKYRLPWMAFHEDITGKITLYTPKQFLNMRTLLPETTVKVWERVMNDPAVITLKNNMMTLPEWKQYDEYKHFKLIPAYPLDILKERRKIRE